jgi:hypothetical protein
VLHEVDPVAVEKELAEWTARLSGKCEKTDALSLFCIAAVHKKCLLAWNMDFDLALA